MTTITKLFPTGILQSRVEFDEYSLSYGQEEFTTPGTYSWTAPAGVTRVSVVAVGGGGAGDTVGYPDQNYAHTGGAGGSLAWRNNISVTPGQTYTVVVGAGGQVGTYPVTNGGASYFIDYGTVSAGGGTGGQPGRIGSGSGLFTGDGGGQGGVAYYAEVYGGGGGGAGGYNGTGGFGGQGGTTLPQLGQPPVTNSGGGYGGNAPTTSSTPSQTNNGGGVGIYGRGADGASAGQPGSGGSGKTYGGGGYAGYTGFGGWAASAGGGGAVRIIWGSGRAFPSTNTNNIGLATSATGSPTFRVSPTGVYAREFDEVSTSIVTNLLTYTEEFNNSIWNKTIGNSGVTANTDISPAGTLTADRISSGPNQGVFYQGTTVSSGTTYTASIYLKLNGGTVTSVQFKDIFTGNGGFSMNVNAVTGEITEPINLIAYGSVDAGEGWKRLWFTYSPPTTTAQISITPYNQVGTYVVWGAQLEVGTTLGPYQGIGAAGTIIGLGYAERRTSSGTYLVSGYFDEVTLAPPPPVTYYPTGQVFGDNPLFGQYAIITKLGGKYADVNTFNEAIWNNLIPLGSRVIVKWNNRPAEIDMGLVTQVEKGAFYNSNHYVYVTNPSNFAMPVINGSPLVDFQTTYFRIAYE